MSDFLSAVLDELLPTKHLPKLLDPNMSSEAAATMANWLAEQGVCKRLEGDVLEQQRLLHACAPRLIGGLGNLVLNLLRVLLEKAPLVQGCCGAAFNLAPLLQQLELGAVERLLGLGCLLCTSVGVADSVSKSSVWQHDADAVLLGVPTSGRQHGPYKGMLAF